MKYIDSISALFFGFMLGLTFILVLVSTFPPSKVLKLYSLEHGLGHYDSRTSNYIQDSLVQLDDSTIRIIKK